VDGMGIVRSRYRVGLPPADVLLGDLRSVVREASAATGAARLAYEAAHLFQCYPPR
jgi:protein SCO1